MTVLLVALGAAVGAPLRYLVDRAVRARGDPAFPWGTLLVNVAGSLLLGVLVGGAPPGPVGALVGTGFCGALTTYSTFGYETLRLWRDGSWRLATLNVTAHLVAGLAAAGAGLALGAALAP